MIRVDFTIVLWVIMTEKKIQLITSTIKGGKW